MDISPRCQVLKSGNVDCSVRKQAAINIYNILKRLDVTVYKSRCERREFFLRFDFVLTVCSVVAPNTYQKTVWLHPHNVNRLHPNEFIVYLFQLIIRNYIVII